MEGWERVSIDFKRGKITDLLKKSDFSNASTRPLPIRVNIKLLIICGIS